MKVSVVCANYLIALATLTVECHRHSDVSRDCQELHHITAMELSSFDSGNFRLFEIEMKYKCYALCLLQRTDYLDARGKLSMEKLSMREDVAAEQLDLIAECKTEHDVEDHPCEYGFGIITCMMRVIQMAYTPVEIYGIN